jgi:hypothetical protein
MATQADVVAAVVATVILVIAGHHAANVHVET